MADKKVAWRHWKGCHDKDLREMSTVKKFRKTGSIGYRRKELIAGGGVRWLIRVQHLWSLPHQRSSTCGASYTRGAALVVSPNPEVQHLWCRPHQRCSSCGVDHTRGAALVVPPMHTKGAAQWDCTSSLMSHHFIFTKEKLYLRKWAIISPGLQGFKYLQNERKVVEK